MWDTAYVNSHTLPSVAAAFAIGMTAAAFNGSDILTKHLGFDAADLQRIERGEIVGRTLPTANNEVAVAAVGIIHVPIAYYLERFDKIESFKKSEDILQIGRFSAAPVAADLAALTVDSADVAALRHCRPGSCAVNLDSAGMARVRGGDHAVAYREYLAAYAAKYLREGNAALMEYHTEGKRPVVDGLRSIAGRSAYLKQWPTMLAAITEYNGSLPPDFRHFVYWSKEKTPGKAILNVAHAIVRQERDGIALVAGKQIYASHYMSASLGITVLVNKDTAEGPRTLVIYINRTHVDLFEGMLGPVKRPILRSRARGTAERSLTRLLKRLQSDWDAK